MLTSKKDLTRRKACYLVDTNFKRSDCLDIKNTQSDAVLKMDVKPSSPLYINPGMCRVTPCCWTNTDIPFSNGKSHGGSIYPEAEEKETNVCRRSFICYCPFIFYGTPAVIHNFHRYRVVRSFAGRYKQ